MKKLIVLLVIGIFALGCDEPPTQKDNQASYVHYYKDSRTDICFAGDGVIGGNNHLDHNHSHLTSVPCSDAVERLVEPWPNFNP